MASYTISTGGGNQCKETALAVAKRLNEDSSNRRHADDAGLMVDLPVKLVWCDSPESMFVHAVEIVETIGNFDGFELINETNRRYKGTPTAANLHKEDGVYSVRYEFEEVEW